MLEIYTRWCHYPSIYISIWYTAMNVFSVVNHLLGYIIEYNELRLKSQQIIQCSVSRSRFIKKGSCFGCLLITKVFFTCRKGQRSWDQRKKKCKSKFSKLILRKCRWVAARLFSRCSLLRHIAGREGLSSGIGNYIKRFTLHFW